MSLKTIPTEDLLKEIEKRKQEKKEQERPKILTDISLYNLKKLAESYLNSVEAGQTREDDEHWFYEEVLETLYGKNIWKWINSFM